ncbi:MAG: YfcE family phosphodiesterase [Pseudomonadales bacterium]|nr:YfcE family phosphodiesterase [Pseudomonadales bacterium]
MRIGLIADTHMPGSIEALWPQAYDAFREVDAILHAGDLHTLDVVDELNQLAPTYVARGNGDHGIVDQRLRDFWVLELGGLTVGMIHKFPSPERKPAEFIEGYMTRHFGEVKLDVLVYGHTHLEGLYRVGEMVCVNPGSPTLPKNQSIRHGTIGILDISPESSTVSILQITEEGVRAHDSLQPHSF